MEKQRQEQLLKIIEEFKTISKEPAEPRFIKSEAFRFELKNGFSDVIVHTLSILARQSSAI